MARVMSISGLVCGVAAWALLLGGCAEGPGGKAFDSPEAAAAGLVSALQSHDKAAVLEVLGPGSEEIVSSGDAVADREASEKFVSEYNAKHSIDLEGDEATLVVGANEWPMPVPIVKTGNTWSFDGKAGKEEILSRRIGRNELETIEVCLAIVDAQREYAAGGFDGGAYARKILSDPGTKDGLHWERGPGEPMSPLGSLVAKAEAQGYSVDPARRGEPRPFHGYCFRLLTAQGPNAEGGAKNYEVNGKLTEGFALVAYPVDYGNSGVMTFMVNQDGLVFEKDLGTETAKIATEMKTFDPGEGWEVQK